MIDIYIDGASLDEMREARKNPLVKGFTTNPSLCRAAGITDYEKFCHEAVICAKGMPISFEVLSDDFIDMERQARKLSDIEETVYVKIPITNTMGDSSLPLINKLSEDGIKVNATAVFTYEHINSLMPILKAPSIISIFAGRIADTGISPKRRMIDAVNSACERMKGIKILWASPREVLNIHQAEQCGCDIITIPLDMLKKYEQLKGKDLTEFSLDTVKMFYNDATKAGYTL